MSQANPYFLTFLPALPVLRSVLGVAWFCFVLSVTSTAARLYTRIYMLRQFGLDDFLLCVAMLCSLASMPMVHVVHREYDGSLRLMIFDGADPATLIRLVVKLVLPLKLQFIMSVMYPISLALIKISIVAFYRRFLPRKPYHFFLYACAAGMAMLGIAVALATTFQCKPVQRAWDPLNAKCTETNSTLQGVIVNVFNLVTDLVLLLLPVPVVLRLRTDRRKKIALMLLFSMGAVGTAVTALRLWKVTVLSQLYGNDTNSPRWFIEMTHVVLLSHIEFSMIVVCANLPALAAWLKRSIGSGASSGARSTGSRTLSCGLSSCGLSSCGKNSGTTSQLGGDGGAGDATGGGRRRSSGERHGLLRHLRWWGAPAYGARRGARAGRAGAAARNSRGSYAYRLKALRAPERSFNRSAQDTATACESESVENFVLVAQDEADARHAAQQRAQGDGRQPYAQLLPAHQLQPHLRQQQQQQQRWDLPRKPVPLPHSPPPAQHSRRLDEQPGQMVPAPTASDVHEHNSVDTYSLEDDVEGARPGIHT